jgi:hypothetical protein
LVGVYCKRLEPESARPNAPMIFQGMVVIELKGLASEIDSSNGDWPARVQLGESNRPDEEVARFADRNVSVEGNLVLEPQVTGEHARTFPLPTLMEPRELHER